MRSWLALALCLLSLASGVGWADDGGGGDDGVVPPLEDVWLSGGVDAAGVLDPLNTPPLSAVLEDIKENRCHCSSGYSPCS